MGGFANEFSRFVIHDKKMGMKTEASAVPWGGVWHSGIAGLLHEVQPAAVVAHGGWFFSLFADVRLRSILTSIREEVAMWCRKESILAHTVFAFFLLFLAVDSQADPRQWGDSGLAVRQGADITSYTVVQNSDGQHLTVWSDLRAGHESVYAQLISSSGVPLWTPDGLLVSDQPFRQLDPVAVAVNGGWIVFWIEFRGYGENAVIRAQKLDNTGARLWPDNDFHGVAVHAFEWVWTEIRVAADDDNDGALVAWHNSNSLHAQRISGTGSVLWTTPAAFITEGAIHRWSSSVAGSNGLIAVWQDNAIPGTRRLLASKISLDGLRLWGENGREVAAYPSSLSDLAMSGDDAGGCFITWAHIDYPQIRVQHLNAAGDTLFPAAGADVSPYAANYGMYLDVRPCRTGGAVDGCCILWNNSPDPLFPAEAYVQKISLSGQKLWSPNGIQISGLNCGAGSDYVIPRMESDSAGGAVVVWSAFTGYETENVFASRVDANGNLPWANGCVQVSTVGTLITQPAIIAPASGGSMILWVANSGGEDFYRYQKIDHATGQRAFAAEGVTVTSGISRDVLDYRLANLAPGRHAVVWSDVRFATRGMDVFYQVLDDSGQTELAPNGQQLIQTPDSVYRFHRLRDLCADGTGGFFAVYMAINSGIEFPRVIHIDAQNQAVGSDTGEAVFTDVNHLGSYEYSLCIPDGAGGCYVATALYDAQFVLDIWIQRLNAVCQPVWNQSVRLMETDDDDVIQGMLPGTDGSCLLIWKNGFYSDYNLMCAQILPVGRIGWQQPLCAAPNQQGDAAVASDHAGGFYACWEDLRSPYRELYAQHVSATGQMLWGTDGIRISPEYINIVFGKIVSNSAGHVYIAWLQAGAQPFDLKIRKFDATGSSLWTNIVSIHIPNSTEQSGEVSLSPDAGDGLFVFYTDYEDYRYHIYGTHFDPDGETVADPYWADNRGLVSAFGVTENEISPILSPDGNGGLLVAYQRFTVHSDELLWQQLYAQRLYDGFTASPEEPVPAPRRFALHQNYPNPFNPATEIRFELAHGAKTTLQVFDVLGRNVKTLIDAPLSAGEHRIHFDGSDLPSGMYFCRLQAADFTQSKKMLLLK